MYERNASLVLRNKDKTRQTLLPNVMFVEGPSEAADPDVNGVQVEEVGD